MSELVPDHIRHHLLADGRKLAWREFGQGRPLVMLHGWSMSGAVFYEVATQLADEFLVLCPDLAGHGWSDPDGEYSLESLTTDLVDWLNTLGLTSLCLLGWSLGGQIAMRLATGSEVTVQRLLLVSTTPRFCRADQWPHGLPQGQVQVMGRQLKSAYLKTLGDFFDLQFAGELLPEKRRRELLTFAVRSSRLPQPDDCLAILNVLSAGDCRAWLMDIDCPTLVMHGTADQIIPCGAGHYLAEQITDGQLYLLEKIGHAPFMSSPDETSAIWRGFLK